MTVLFENFVLFKKREIEMAEMRIAYSTLKHP